MTDSPRRIYNIMSLNERVYPLFLIFVLIYLLLTSKKINDCCWEWGGGLISLSLNYFISELFHSQFRLKG